MAFEVLMNEIRGLGLDIRLHRPEDMSFGEAASTLDFGAPSKPAEDLGMDQEFVAEQTSGMGDGSEPAPLGDE
jgi:hypothetical protein